MSYNTILVTGGAGFIGSAMAHRLIESGKKVVIIDNLHTGKKENIPEEAEFIEGDISKKETYDQLSQYSIDSVFHLAAQSGGVSSFDDPDYDKESHVDGTYNLLQWCQSSSVDRLLYASSVAVYGEPEATPVDEQAKLSPKTYYGAGKQGAEAYVNLFDNMGMETTIFRLFNVYGPNQSLDNRKQGMVSIYLSFVMRSDKLEVKGPLDRVRDFIYINDVIDAWMKAHDEPDTFGETFNLATGTPTEVGELINIMLKKYGEPEFPVEVVEGTPGDQFAVYGDISKIRDTLDWEPSVSVDEGLTRMIDYELENMIDQNQ